jgi:5'-3' exonuclease
MDTRISVTYGRLNRGVQFYKCNCMSRLAIIDGDVLCYRCFEPRWQDKVDPNAPITLDPVTGHRIKEEIVYTKEEDAKYLQEAWERFERHVRQLLEKLYCTDYVMAVKHPSNFRDEMYCDYKKKRGNWRPSEMSKFVPIIARLAVNSGYAIWAEGRETDDYVRIWAEEARAAGIDFIVCSIDKDLKCIPGKHYNMKHDKIEDVDEAFATRFFYTQLLMGDVTVDNIPGIPGVGPVKAEKWLAEWNTEEEFQAEVVGRYMGAHGDEWKQYLLANGKLLYIQKRLDDWFTVDHWPVVKDLEA